MATGDLQPDNNMVKKRQAGGIFQVKKEGVSTDYKNKTIMVRMQCKALLGVQNFSILNYGSSEIEVRKKVWESIKKMPTYTEYMDTHSDAVDGFYITDFITQRGREIIARLDQIVLELRNSYTESSDSFDVGRVSALFEEIDRLISEQ